MIPKRFRSVKSEIRVLGIDDGGFVPRTKGIVTVVGQITFTQLESEVACDRLLDL